MNKFKTYDINLSCPFFLFSHFTGFYNPCFFLLTFQTCVVRAWDFSVKPLIVCPAMNTLMWSHPHTATHMQMLKDLGMVIIPPIAKRLACGDVGKG